MTHKNKTDSSMEELIYEELEGLEVIQGETMESMVGGLGVGLGDVDQQGQVRLASNPNAGAMIADQAHWLKGQLETAYQQEENIASSYGESADLPEGEIKATINQLDSDMLEGDVMLNAHGVREFVSAWESNINSQIPQGSGIPVMQGFGHQIEEAWMQRENAEASAAASDPVTGGASGSVTAGLQLHQGTATGQEMLGQVQAIVYELEKANAQEGLDLNPNSLIVKEGAKLLYTLEESGHTLTYAGEQQFMANVSEKYFEQGENNPSLSANGQSAEQLSYGNITSAELRRAAETFSTTDRELVSGMEQTLQSDYAQNHLSGTPALTNQQLDLQVVGAEVSFIEQTGGISNSDTSTIVNLIENQDNITLGKQVHAIETVIAADQSEAAQTGFYDNPQAISYQAQVEKMALNYANGGSLDQEQAEKIIVQTENTTGITLARQEYGMLEDLQVQETWAKNYIQGTAPTAAELTADLANLNQQGQGLPLRSSLIDAEIEQVDLQSGLSGAMAAKSATQYLETLDQQVQAFNLHDPNLSATEIKTDVEQIIANNPGKTVEALTGQVIKQVEQETGIDKAVTAFTTAEAEINYAETQIPVDAVPAGKHMAQDLAQEATAIESVAGTLTTAQLETDVVRAYENTHGITAGMIEEAIYNDVDTANSNETFISQAQIKQLNTEVPQEVAAAMASNADFSSVNSSLVLQSRQTVLDTIVQNVEDSTGITNALNENAHYIALQDLGSWNLGKEMAGLKYIDPTLEKAVVGTLWATTAVTAVAGVASIASAGMAFFAAEPAVAAAEATTTAAEVAAETAGTSTFSGALSEVSNAVADTLLKGMIQTFDAAAQISSISVADGLNAAANAVLRGMTQPLDSLSAWSNATIDWARVVEVSAGSGVRDLSYQEMGEEAVDVVEDSGQISQYETELNAAQTEMNSFKLANFFVSRATPGPVGFGVHMALGLTGAGAGVGGIGYGTGEGIRDLIKYLHKNDNS